MHLRRALLLFAVVLVAAALVASIGQQARESSRKADATPPSRLEEPSPRPQARFSTTGRPAVRRLPVGRAAQVVVTVEAPSAVELPELGLSAPAEPGTPARFEVLLAAPGRQPVFVTPTGSSRERVGTLTSRPR